MNEKLKIILLVLIAQCLSGLTIRKEAAQPMGEELQIVTQTKTPIEEQSSKTQRQKPEKARILAEEQARKIAQAQRQKTEKARIATIKKTIKEIEAQKQKEEQAIKQTAEKVIKQTEADKKQKKQEKKQKSKNKKKK